MNENKGIMSTKIELTPEQSQQGGSNDILNIKVILPRIYSDDGNPSRAIIKQALRVRGSYALRWKPCQGDSSKLNLLDTGQSSRNQRYQDYQDKDCQGSLLASFQDDAKYEHVGQDTIRQCGKDKEKQGKDLKILGLKTKSKDNDKGSRSKITQHEGTSL
ncbi:hypothetical protein Tco_1390922 [Tanacetum coccineum]